MLNSSHTDPGEVTNSKRVWGSMEWFHHLFTTQGCQDPASYFSENGYHIFRHQQLTDFLAKTTLPSTKHAMLDIGCGTGSSTILISNRCGFVKTYGMDFVYDLLKHAQINHPSLYFQVGALPMIPYRSQTLDLVVICEVLYYLSKNQQERTLEEINRVLKCGGTLLFSSALGKKYFHRTDILSLLSSKFEVVQHGYSYNRLYHLIIGPLYLLKRLHHLLVTGVEPGTPQSSELMLRYSWLLNLKLFRFFLEMICPVTDPILRLTQIPVLLNKLCQIFCPWLTRTNIMVVAKSKDKLC